MADAATRVMRLYVKQIGSGISEKPSTIRPTMLKHNTYFDGKVQSVGYERHGRKQTVGVIAAGEFHFNTDGAERMTVINGELQAKLPGGQWQTYAAGTAFEVPAKSGFDVKAGQPAGYWCEFI
jgi:purine/pyrimidine-nucleoside phosphorylase